MNSTNKTDKKPNKSSCNDTDPEVKESPRYHRRYSAAYKLKILEMADACKAERGGVGRLLRAEGLYSNMLSEWRKARGNGVLTGLSPKKRGVNQPIREPSSGA